MRPKFIEPARAHQGQHQLQRQVRLRRRPALGSQEAGEIGGCRVGRIELRHRWDDAPNAQFTTQGQRTQWW